VAELGEFLLDYVIKERVQRVLFFFVTLSCLSKAVRYRPTGGATCLDFSQCGRALWGLWDPQNRDPRQKSPPETKSVEITTYPLEAVGGASSVIKP